jgi:hypothetical protein
MSNPLDVAREVRPHFPAVTDDFIFGDNAGGSQILKESVDAISNYLLTSNVQMGGRYTHSVEAAKRVEKGKEAAAVLTNVEGGAGQIVIGSSTTQLASNLGHACALAGKSHGLFEQNDEIIISAADHEGKLFTWSYRVLAQIVSDSRSECWALGPTCERVEPDNQILASHSLVRIRLSLRYRTQSVQPGTSALGQYPFGGIYRSIKPSRSSHARQGCGRIGQIEDWRKSYDCG